MERGGRELLVRLSALVCVRNEGAILSSCLRHLTFVDELVVVLDRCNDASEAIAKTFKARIVAGEFPIEGLRKAAGIAACTGEWVLEVDADEVVSDALAREVRVVINAGTHDWHLIPIENYVGDHLIRHGWGSGSGTTRTARLYRRGAKTWAPRRVHPPAQFTGCQGPLLTNPIRHNVDADISDMLARLDRYTMLHAQDLVESGQVGGVWSNMFRGVRRFWKCYVNRKGYKEGDWGVLIALVSGLYPILSTLRARLEAHVDTTDVLDVIDRLSQ